MILGSSGPVVGAEMEMSLGASLGFSRRTGRAVRSSLLGFRVVTIRGLASTMATKRAMGSAWSLLPQESTSSSESGPSRRSRLVLREIKFLMRRLSIFSVEEGGVNVDMAFVMVSGYSLVCDGSDSWSGVLGK
jgi:hypothetical protein